AMGGVLPEQPDPASFQRIIDVGCGTGDWLIETATTYPSISLLIGVDISNSMIEFARMQAAAAGVNDRVEFHVMDALRMLEFPEAYFDLVTHRAAASWLRTWDWRKLLQEYRRIGRPGGVVRVVESDADAQSTSPALSALYTLFRQAFYQAGRLFTPERDGLTKELAKLLRQHGFQNVQTRVFPLEYRAGTLAGDQFIENVRLSMQTFQPFMHRWMQVPDNFEEMQQQALREMQQPDFVATTRFLAAWGTVPF
ncbi:MAG TPA: class I SAM-dependent methyltransferase, partial [Ktedonobacteraceae bacterium]|nr:class I SAM-dependent methyltransferase [Ktedonobacteraceae bacterium]